MAFRSEITLDLSKTSTQGEFELRFDCKFPVTALRHERRKLTFGRPFSIKGIDRPLPPGDYELVPDHELVSELYFPLYRQVVTLISVPSQAYRRSSVVKTNVYAADILASHRRDQAGAVETDGATLQTPSKDVWR